MFNKNEFTFNNTDVLTRERKFSRKIDQFSFELIPRIKENIQSLILDDLSIEQVLSLGYYPNLSQLTPINIPIEFISYIFLGLFFYCLFFQIENFQ